jgi:hypothetical protein
MDIRERRDRKKEGLPAAPNKNPAYGPDAPYLKTLPMPLRPSKLPIRTSSRSRGETEDASSTS